MNESTDAPEGETVDEIENAAALWIAREHREGQSAADRQAFDAWLAGSTARRVAWLRLRQGWQRSAAMAVLPASPLPSPTSASAQTDARERSWHTSRTWRIAAAVMLSTVALAGSWRWLANDAADYRTAVGARRDIALADGSYLLLNTDTRLRARVGKDGRRVWLDRGEAFFDIAHDATKPFVIEAGHQRITVVGTRFSVRRTDDSTTVIVAEGTVNVASTDPASGQAPLTVSRDDVVVATPRAMVKQVLKPPAVADALSWREGKVVFDQATLAEAAAQFNRYNDRKLVLADRAVSEIRIGGRFAVDNVQAFARLLHQGFGVGVQVSDAQIILSAPAGGK